jgi:hypothetical protein
VALNPETEAEPDTVKAYTRPGENFLWHLVIQALHAMLVGGATIEQITAAPSAPVPALVGRPGSGAPRAHLLTVRWPGSESGLSHAFIPLLIGMWQLTGR